MKVVKSTFTKSDGRIFIQYHEDSLKNSERILEMIDEGLIRPLHFTEPTVRFNAMRQEWVAISSSRNDRPFLPPANYCPLCPGSQYSRNEQGEECKTDVPLMSVPYEWAVLENMFPGLGHGNQTGHCEVILYCKEHDRPLSQASTREIQGLICVWQDRSYEVGRRDDVKFVYIFENKGVEVGVTLHHPHGQLYGMNHIPPFLERELKAAVEHWTIKKKCLICDIAHDERCSTRVIVRTPNIIAYIPKAARYPYEVHLTTLSHRPRIEDLTAVEVHELSQVIKVLLTKYNLLMAREFPYIMGQHQVPHKPFSSVPISSLESAYHWHMEFYPPYRAPGKLKYLAGVESGTGLFINDTIPEIKAKELRELKTEFDKLLEDNVQNNASEPLSNPNLPSLEMTDPQPKKALARAPGRINLIGEHTDYNGGKVLPFTFDRYVDVSFTAHFHRSEDSPTIRVRSKSHQPELIITLSSLHQRVRHLVDSGKMTPTLSPPDLRSYLLPQERSTWQRYMAGIFLEWWFNKQRKCGFSWEPDKKSPLEPSLIEIEIDSNLPHGAGVSSSAALCMAVLLGLDHLYREYWNGTSTPPLALTRDAAALHAMRVEHQFAGTRCGLMDQLAIGKCHGGGFLMIDFGNPSPLEPSDPISGEYPSLPVFPHRAFSQYEWLLVNSNIRHNLGASPYNERRQSCEEGLKAIQDYWPKLELNGPPPDSLGILACSDPFLNKFLKSESQFSLAKELFNSGVISTLKTSRRVAHAIYENRRVEAAIKALKWGAPMELHEALIGSHRSLADEFDVSCPEIEKLGTMIRDLCETLWISHSAQDSYIQSNKNNTKFKPEIPSHLGPRMTGGGFGGSMIVGVHQQIVDPLIEQITSPNSTYAKMTGLIPEVLKVSPKPGLTVTS